MTATELGNRPASEMTYRQAIVLALLPTRMNVNEETWGQSWAICNYAAGEILAREAQEAGDAQR